MVFRDNIVKYCTAFEILPTVELLNMLDRVLCKILSDTVDVWKDNGYEKLHKIVCANYGKHVDDRANMFIGFTNIAQHFTSDISHKRVIKQLKNLTGRAFPVYSDESVTYTIILQDSMEQLISLCIKESKGSRNGRVITARDLKYAISTYGGIYESYYTFIFNIK